MVFTNDGAHPFDFAPAFAEATARGQGRQGKLHDAPYPINGLPERRFRWLRLFATQNFDPATKPISFIVETVSASDAFHCAVTFKDIEADAPLQLAQTNRTEVQRATIT